MYGCIHVRADGSLRFEEEDALKLVQALPDDKSSAYGEVALGEHSRDSEEQVPKRKRTAMKDHVKQRLTRILDNVAPSEGIRGLDASVAELVRGMMVESSARTHVVDGRAMVAIKKPLCGAVQCSHLCIPSPATKHIELVMDVSTKLSRCFDEDGRIVTIAVVPPRASHQGSEMESPLRKVRRVDGSFAEFKIWSTMLCQWSDVFSAMLTRGMRESAGRIDITDFTAEVVEASLRCLHSGKLSVQVDKLVEVEVGAFADKYAMHELKDLVKCALKQVPSGKICVQTRDAEDQAVYIIEWTRHNTILQSRGHFRLIGRVYTGASKGCRRNRGLAHVPDVGR